MPKDSGRAGLLIGAIAVVAAVAVGVGIALSMDDERGDEEKGAERPPVSSSSGQDNKKNGGGREEGGEGKAGPKPKAMPPVTDAASLVLNGGATRSTQHAGAFGKGGTYVDGMQTPGASITWKFQLPKAGQYQYNVRYGNAGNDTKATLLVNGKPQSINLRNHTKQNDWSKAWTRSYGDVTLQKGSNVIDLTCGGGDGCAFVVDQVAITTSGYPSNWP